MSLYFYNKCLPVQTNEILCYVAHKVSFQLKVFTDYVFFSFLGPFYFPASPFFLHTLGSSPLL